MVRERWNAHEGNPKGLVSNWVNLVRHTWRLVRALMDDTEWTFGAEDRKSAPERAPSWNEINIPSLGWKLLCSRLRFDGSFWFFGRIIYRLSVSGLASCENKGDDPNWPLSYVTGDA